MRVILLTDVKKVGRKGEVVNVADGYAQNVLIPKKLAAPGTPESLKRAVQAGEQKESERTNRAQALQQTIESLRGKTLTITALANDKGTLFKTLRNHDLTDAIQRQLGVSIPESALSAPEIKKVGEYMVTISSGRIKTAVSVLVKNV